MMQDGKKPQNIFEAASQLEKERREKEIKRQAAAETPVLKPAQNTQLSEIFQRCQNLHNEISKSLEQAFKKGGVTPSQLRTYVSRPQNFSEADWKRIEQQKKRTETMIQDLKRKVGKGKSAEQAMVEPKAIEPKEEAPPSSQPQTQEPTSAKPPAKKAKIITKRQWIGM